MGDFCALSPKPIFALSIAAHSRFAKAEENALRLMHGEALAFWGIIVPQLHMLEMPYRMGL